MTDQPTPKPKRKAKRFTVEELETAAQNDSGFCIACGAEAEDAIEPDARRYHCSACGENHVYGAEEITLMGLVKLDETAEA